MLFLFLFFHRLLFDFELCFILFGTQLLLFAACLIRSRLDFAWLLKSCMRLRTRSLLSEGKQTGRCFNSFALSLRFPLHTALCDSWYRCVYLILFFVVPFSCPLEELASQGQVVPQASMLT